MAVHWKISPILVSLRNLKEKTLRYRFRMGHVPGVHHCAADCISRHPTGEPEKLFLSDDVAVIHSATIMDGLRTPAPETSTIEKTIFTSTVSTLDTLSM